MVAYDQLEHRLTRLERTLKLQRWALTTIFGAVAFSFSFTAQGSGDTPQSSVLRARGLVIEDAHGRPRIALGAPLEHLAGRNRSDPLTGMVYLDPNGNDRLTFGQLPDPNGPEGLLPRRVGGAGILIHDRDGVERGGYSVLDDETAVLTLDWPKAGEAVALSASPGMAGMGLFYRSPIGQYRDAFGSFVFPGKDSTLVKMSDGNGKERLILRTSENGQPQITQFDAAGNELVRKR